MTCSVYRLSCTKAAVAEQQKFAGKCFPSDLHWNFLFNLKSSRLKVKGYPYIFITIYSVYQLQFGIIMRYFFFFYRPKSLTSLSATGYSLNMLYIATILHWKTLLFRFILQLHFFFLNLHEGKLVLESCFIIEWEKKKKIIFRYFKTKREIRANAANLSTCADITTKIVRKKGWLWRNYGARVKCRSEYKLDVCRSTRDWRHGAKVAYI